jgi:hypothetical protein
MFGDIPYSLICSLTHINLEPCVGHLITKTILEMAQGHISLSDGPKPEYGSRAESDPTLGGDSH